jgi:hypothetical protein
VWEESGRSAAPQKVPIGKKQPLNALVRLLLFMDLHILIETSANEVRFCSDELK